MPGARSCLGSGVTVVNGSRMRRTMVADRVRVAMVHSAAQATVASDAKRSHESHDHEADKAEDEKS
jgi:hypothetical protein